MRDATLEQVLQALRSSFKFQYRGAAALHDAISGTYSGSLPRVVANLLQGHDYVMHGSPDDLGVVILGPSGAVPMVVMQAPIVMQAPVGRQTPAGREPLKECQYNGIPVEC
jgi:hypothetical protein